MSTAYLNGRWIDAAHAVIPADDAGFLHGDAVFETGRRVPGGYFRLDQHLDRLRASAVALTLPLPPVDELLDVATGLAERNDFEHGTLRITLTRGGAAGPLLLATLTPLASDWHERARRGWRVITAGICHPSLACLPPVKTPGRLHGLLARAEARRAGADDALLLDTHGTVTEGPSWNVFWRAGDALYTPAPGTGILEGVTRAVILELAPAAGLTVRQGLYRRQDLDDADEVFATMTSVGIVPFMALDGRDLSSEAATAASSLQTLYWDLVAAEARMP